MKRASVVGISIVLGLIIIAAIVIANHYIIRPLIQPDISAVGGVHMVLKVENPQNGLALNDARDAVLQIVKSRVSRFGIGGAKFYPVDDDRIAADIPGIANVDSAKMLLGSSARLEFKLLRTPEEAQALVAAFDSVLAPDSAPKSVKGSVGEKAIDTKSKASELLLGNQTLDKEENHLSSEEFARIHPFSSLMSDWGGHSFYVEADDYQRALQLLAKPEIQALVPPDYQLAWATRYEKRGNRLFQQLFILNAKVEMTGAHLAGIKESRNGMQMPTILIELDNEGSRLFENLTGSHIGDALAIVIDDKVESAPTIQSRIKNYAQITLGGSATMDDAFLLTTLLRAGAFPAAVQVIECQRVERHSR